MEGRQNWLEYFLTIAKVVATRSTCIRRQVGAVAVDKRNRIIGTGYNGAPSGFPHCTKETCYRTVHNIPSGQCLDKCFAVHAETNAMFACGSRIDDIEYLYITNQPCTNCLKTIMTAQIPNIIWESPYPDEFSRSMMDAYGDYAEINGVFCLKKRSS